MPIDYQRLFDDSFLLGEYGTEYRAFVGSPADIDLKTALETWSGSLLHRERSMQGAFVSKFFVNLWGYIPSGHSSSGHFSVYEQFPVARSGARGGTGWADAALGYFTGEKWQAPQVFCEFKDIRSDLDSPQLRKDSTRSPVKQCQDYIREACSDLRGDESAQPVWGIVTDMNEFRLYWRNRMPSQYQKFVIKPKLGDDSISLIGDDEQASLQRFLFQKIFKPEFLITETGEPELLKLLKRQWVREKEIEGEFYKEYKDYRDTIIHAIKHHNRQIAPGKSVRLAQKILDRLIFILFCEDMGAAIRFPHNLLTEYLRSYSQSEYYDSASSDVWNKLKDLFRCMNDGMVFAGKEINKFNGGLFAPDATLDNLNIPSKLFCERRQGQDSKLSLNKKTLLYLAASYNYGVTAQGRASISLYTMGRIFEQSITDLEALEAEAERRESITKLSKRKQDGVYYTPEWIVEWIVEETIGGRLRELRAEAGWDESVIPTDRRVKTMQRAAIERYRHKLEKLTVLDLSCGSGAFLIHALRYLLNERRRVSEAKVALTGHLELFDMNEVIKDILSKNIYGVDINPSSVEITKLALWLNTARADKPLCDLDNNIKDGNSLVSPEITSQGSQIELISGMRREIINSFNWEAAFPSIFANGGFDCIVGNPPYIKLQNLVKAYPEVAQYLRDAKKPNDDPLYESSQTSNGDIYLPFIEKGISLLNDNGKLGYIAPSVWTLNEYGAGLRALLHRGKHLEKWVDFKSHQIFKEATNYTALQIYTKRPNEVIRLTYAPEGVINPEWENTEWQVGYSELADQDSWLLIRKSERRLLKRLWKTCKKLDSVDLTSQIFVGVQTSSDDIYHLTRIGNNRFKTKSGDEVTIEDGIMRKLLSGKHVDRYVMPSTDLFVLFPYKNTSNGFCLMQAAEIASSYHHAWQYLQSKESELRGREKRKFDDDGWYRFGRNQNIDKQHLSKIIVPRLVKKLTTVVDESGAYCLDNVDVGGILCETNDLYFICGVLNSVTCNYVWRIISKPFRGDYRSANRQFIAPLPIPNASMRQKRQVANLARNLQELHTREIKILADIEKRLGVISVFQKEINWLWPDIPSIATVKDSLPADSRKKTQTAKKIIKDIVESKLDWLQLQLASATSIEPIYENGELRLSINGRDVINRIFIDPHEGMIVSLQWRLAANAFMKEERIDAKKLVDRLTNLRLPANSPNEQEAMRQIYDYETELSEVSEKIKAKEHEIEEILCALYGLSEKEKKMVYGER